MTARGVLARAAAMDARELRARVSTALRKHAGRLRFAAARPEWKRRCVADILDPSSAPLVADACAAARAGDYLAAHRALAIHLQSRSSRWPLKASRRDVLTGEVAVSFPDAAERARDAAERILDGRLDLLGYHDVLVGQPPRWHRDAIHDRQAPTAYWSEVPYLDPATGDHKVTWELNRHQHFCILGTAHWLTGDARYRSAFVAQLEDWLGHNPPLAGINWASMLELAFRTLSWTWAAELFAAGADDDRSPWLVDLLVGLDRQLAHIANNLSTYFSPNTHLTGEALALFAVSLAFPELRSSASRAALGREILLREAERQILGDGGHAELSPHYHRYSTDFYLLACMVARAADDPAAAAFERTAHRQAAYLRTIADSDGGLPLIGDDDGGRLFRFDRHPAWDASSTLSVAAAVLSDEALSVRSPDAEVFWILGERPEDAAPGARAVEWPSRLLAETGYFVSRGGGHHLVFDAGPHGFLNGGHAHSDALSVVLTVDHHPLFVDAGTATYTMDRRVRDRFRSARMHNTVVLDGRDPAEPAGPFHWRTRSDARFLVARTGRDLDFAVGALAGYPVRHMRAVITLRDRGWLIVDRVAAPQPTSATAWWHLHPSWHARAVAGGLALETAAGDRMGLAFSGGDVMVTRDPDAAGYAPEYGRHEPAAAVRVQRSGAGPFAIATFIAARLGVDERLRLREVDARSAPGLAWVPAAFAIDSGALEIRVEIAFPADCETQPDEGWPQPCIEVLRAKAMALCVE